MSYSDYSPYGTLLDMRHGNDDTYRYGFQGQERDDEIKGAGNSYNYEYRMHDPRIGRFFAIDPLAPKYPYYSPYQFSGNRPIDCVELEGLEPAKTDAKEGEYGAGPDDRSGTGEWKFWQMRKVEGQSGKLDWFDISESMPFLGRGNSQSDGYGSLNLPVNAEVTNIKLITFKPSRDANGSITGSRTPQLRVQQFKIDGVVYNGVFNDDGSFHGYWDLNGGKYSGVLNDDGTYAGNSYESKPGMPLTNRDFSKIPDNFLNWTTFSKGFSSDVSKKIPEDVFRKSLENSMEKTLKAKISIMEVGDIVGDCNIAAESIHQAKIIYMLIANGPGSSYYDLRNQGARAAMGWEFQYDFYFFKGFYGPNKTPIIETKEVLQSNMPLWSGN